MARGSRLLKILLHPSLESLVVVQELREKGHRVDIGLTSPTSPDSPAVPVWDYDLILGPTCWRMNGVLAKHIPLAIKNSRLEKYGPSGRKEKNNENLPD